MKKHIFVLFILILGVSVLFACRKNDVLSYSEKEKKEIDAVIQKKTTANERWRTTYGVTSMPTA